MLLFFEPANACLLSFSYHLTSDMRYLNVGHADEVGNWAKPDLEHIKTTTALLALPLKPKFECFRGDERTKERSMETGIHALV